MLPGNAYWGMVGWGESVEESGIRKSGEKAQAPIIKLIMVTMSKIHTIIKELDSPLLAWGLSLEGSASVTSEAVAP